MTKNEKGILVIFTITIIGFFSSIWYLNIVIEQSGGIKQVIIDTGKVAKDVVREIGEH